MLDVLVREKKIRKNKRRRRNEGGSMAHTN
jgi:hypothetical protein